MKPIKLPANVTRAFHRAGFKLKKHSPEILVVTGVVGTVASAVMACKATLKANDIIEEHKKNLNDIHDVVADVEAGIIPAEKYTIEDQRKDTAMAYVKTGVSFAKLYGPSVMLGTASILAILGGHNITRKRNSALAAAYMAVDTGFKEYRGRVIERFGKDLDRELKYDIKAKEVEETVVNEDGTEQKVKRTVQVINPNNKSPYAKCFDEFCPAWVKNAEENMFFLKQQESMANKILQERGHLFLNEVYDLLGFDRTAAGQEVGWVYDLKSPVGDNYVDFNIHDLHDPEKRAFANGYEKCIWVDFNVDGVIRHILP